MFVMLVTSVVFVVFDVFVVFHVRGSNERVPPSACMRACVHACMRAWMRAANLQQIFNKASTKQSLCFRFRFTPES